MTYQVFWASSALDELAALWTDADPMLREAITTASAAIDAVLKNSPTEIGESRPYNRRIAFVRPLGFTFEVRSADQRVVVVHVWLIERHES